MESDSGTTLPPKTREDRQVAGTPLQMLFESSLDGILLVNFLGVIYAANPAACRLLGRSEQEIMEAGFGGISGISSSRLLEVIRDSAYAGDFRGEAVLRRKDGVEIPVEISSVALAYKNGEAAAAVVFRDANARRDATQALRRTEALLARERQLSNLGSWELDIASGELFWSEHHYRMFGLRPGEFHPTYAAFLALVHPDDRGRLENATKKALAGERFQVEFRTTLPDSSIRHIYSQSDIDWDAAGTPVRMVGTSRDITARKRAEAALRDSEERYRQIIESTQEGVWLLDCNAVTTYVNPRMSGMLGYAPEEMLGHAVWNFLFEEDRPACKQIFGELKRTQGVRLIEFRYRRKDGSSMWALVNTNPVYDRHGQVVNFLGMFTDITERKRLEEQLRQRAEELQKLMDVAPVALLMARDPECREVIGNRAANDMFEAEEGANLSLAPKEGTLPDRHFFREGVAVLPEEMPLQAAAASGIGVRDWEAEMLTPSGARRFIWGHARPLRDAAGQVRGAVAAYQDITAARQRTQAALRESEERFREAADGSPVIMWLADPRMRAIFLSKGTGVYTGLPVEQLLGDGWQQAIHPDDLDGIRKIYFEGVDKRTGYQTEFRARRADGEYRQMLSSANPRYIGDAYAGQVGTIVDITNLKRRQEEDIARQKLESLGTLAGGVAHDFNNLLAGILSQAELASAQLAEGGSPEAEIGNIRAVAVRGAEVVRQLMVYAGQETEALELVDVSRLVEETIELLKVVASKHATLRPRLGVDVPAVRANPVTLRQILINLVSNASEALGDQDGVVRLTTARVTVAAHSSAAAGGLPPGEYLQLEVSDTGCGMTPETQAKIFDPFFTTKTKGHGLGLPVVDGIVRRLGGKITVRSQRSQGTTLQILLPGAAESVAQGLDRSDAAGGIAGRR